MLGQFAVGGVGTAEFMQDGFRAVNLSDVRESMGELGAEQLVVGRILEKRFVGQDGAGQGGGLRGLGENFVRGGVVSEDRR